MWSSWWKAICAVAGMPGQEFYDLKHRAIQWMVDPVDEGGLGLDPLRQQRRSATTTAAISSPPSTRS